MCIRDRSSVVINLGTGADVPISQFRRPVLARHEAGRLQEQRVVVLRRRRCVGDPGSAGAVTGREPQAMAGDQLLRGGVVVHWRRDDGDIYLGERGERVAGWSSIWSVMVVAVRGAAGLTSTHDSRARIIGSACYRPDAGRQQTSTWSATNTW